MGHLASDQAIKWHASREDLLESDDSRASRQRLYDGERMKLIFSGKEEQNDISNIDQHLMSRYEQDRRWRGQQIDESGKTVIAKTIENAYFKEIPRSYTPNVQKRFNKFAESNLEKIRIASEKNRQLHPRLHPLNNDDLLSVRSHAFGWS